MTDKPAISLRTPLLYPLTLLVFRLYFTLMGGYRVIGAENIPKTGSAIIAPNHVSMADPPLMALTIPRPVKCMAKKELFRIPVIGPIIAHLGTFPVNRGAPDRKALKQALDYLQGGWPMVLFPEGTRGNGKELGPLERGVVMLAEKSAVPVIPTYIDGTFQMLPKGATRPRRSFITVTFGPPIYPNDFSHKKGDDSLSQAIKAGIEALRDATK